MTRAMLLSIKEVEIGDQFTIEGSKLVVGENELFANLLNQHANTVKRGIEATIEDHIHVAIICCIATYIALDETQSGEWSKFPLLESLGDIRDHLGRLTYSEHLRMHVKELFEELFAKTDTNELDAAGQQLFTTAHLMYAQYYRGKVGSC